MSQRLPGLRRMVRPGAGIEGQDPRGPGDSLRRDGDLTEKDAMAGIKKEGWKKVIRDFRSYAPTVDELVDQELRRLPVSESGCRLDLSSPPIAAALKRYREMERIPKETPTFDLLRERFERWYIREKVIEDRRRLEEKMKKTPDTE